MIGLFNPPAAMRARSLESTPVKLKYAVGKRADLCSRTYCAASRALSLPIVICGLFFSANASACFRVRGVLPLCVGRLVAVAGEVRPVEDWDKTGLPARNEKTK